MNKATFLVVLLFPVAAVSAEPPAYQVFSYECAQIADEDVGLECRIEERTTFYWTEDPADLDDEERKYANYLLNRQVLRLFQLGKTRFYVKGVHLNGKYHECYRNPKRTFNYICNVRDE